MRYANNGKKWFQIQQNNEFKRLFYQIRNPPKSSFFLFLKKSNYELVDVMLPTNLFSGPWYPREEESENA